jgi:PTH1 family peptidyl-tRNA hydrolase
LQQIQLIVGLGNPGPEYEATRHNVGAWFVEDLARSHATPFHYEPRFFGKIARIREQQLDYWLLIPTIFMNRSGLSVKNMMRFYKIPTETLLIAHDELDFPAGITRLKQDGGHGGHNGLRDIMQHLQSRNFFRLRIGIGHPGHRDQVIDYVLHKPSKQEHHLITDSFISAHNALPALIAGDIQLAMRQLHNDV